MDFDVAPDSQGPKPKTQKQESISEEQVMRDLDSILYTLNFFRTEGYYGGKGGTREFRDSMRDKNVADLRKRLTEDVKVHGEVLARREAGEKPSFGGSVEQDKNYRKSEIFYAKRMLAAMNLVSHDRIQEHHMSLDDLYKKVKQLKPKTEESSEKSNDQEAKRTNLKTQEFTGWAYDENGEPLSGNMRSYFKTIDGVIDGAIVDLTEVSLVSENSDGNKVLTRKYRGEVEHVTLMPEDAERVFKKARLTLEGNTQASIEQKIEEAEVAEKRRKSREVLERTGL